MSQAFSASRIATEVWVKAAGLMTMPAAFLARLVDPADELVLGVALVEAAASSPSASAVSAAERLDVGEGLAAVDLRLARAEQVQVGSVQHEDGLGQGSLSGSRGRRVADLARNMDVAGLRRRTDRCPAAPRSRCCTLYFGWSAISLKNNLAIGIRTAGVPRRRPRRFGPAARQEAAAGAPPARESGCARVVASRRMPAPVCRRRS